MTVLGMVVAVVALDLEVVVPMYVLIADGRVQEVMISLAGW
jgi:hypothetical protein